ncbi:MAG: DUF4070 domain-containing protein, partial [Snowella sp.]
YIEAFWELYEPLAFLNRTYRHFLILGEAQRRNLENRKSAGSPDITWVNLRALFILCWRQGVMRETRWQFWINLFALSRRYPEVVTNYLSVCAQAEHFLEFRELVRSQIELQLAAFKTRQAAVECPTEMVQKSELVPVK